MTTRFFLTELVVAKSENNLKNARREKLPKPLYIPALRLKAGELGGIANVSEILKKHIRPHFIVPPKAERDATASPLFDTLERYPDAGLAISKFWKNRFVMINPKFIYEEFGEDRAKDWLPSLFDSARGNGVYAVPVTSLNDLSGDRHEGLNRAVDRTSAVQLALSVSAEDLITSGLKSRIDEQLDRIKVNPEKCSILIDFDGSYFEQLDGVTDVIEASLQDVQAMGQWETIVFQGSSFPTKNPADHKSTILIPRNEWLAWKKAVDLSAKTPGEFVFGDYAADSSRITFKKGRAPAIRHYRYATSDSWLIARASEFGKDAERMKWVSENIVESGVFAGRHFSLADDFIFRTAKENGGPGNSTTWRQINTTHHLTRVVQDISEARGIRVEKPMEQTFDKQTEMLV